MPEKTHVSIAHQRVYSLPPCGSGRRPGFDNSKLLPAKQESEGLLPGAAAVGSETHGYRNPVATHRPSISDGSQECKPLPFPQFSSFGTKPMVCMVYAMRWYIRPRNPKNRIFVRQLPGRNQISTLAAECHGFASVLHGLSIAFHGLKFLAGAAWPAVVS
jgi:hypothetical protein